MRKFPLCLALLAFVFLASLSYAQPVAAVTTVEVPAANVQDYLTALKGIEPLLKKHSSTAKMRVWRMTFAGTVSNQLVVVVELESLAALADYGKMYSDPEFKTALRTFEGLGREIVSVTLATDVTP